ncbi:MAG: long-chain fatty acid--CoA ligase [Bacteroidetes bacterium]|nr:long-chain fatty acid--CoA ligase [Bacteroidota bacterium]
MIQPSRLFDCIPYQLEKFSDLNMLSSKVNGVWKSWRTKDVEKMVNRLSAGLLEMGIGLQDGTDEGCDKIGIISNNRPEWIITDLAVQQTGAVLVPIYPTTNPLELKFILNDAAVKIMFVSSADLKAKVELIAPEVPSLKKIYSFDEIDHTPLWTEIADLATEDSLRKIEEIKSKIPDSHLATLIYTSGTTGTPKGVMLTHSNIFHNAMYAKESFPFPDDPHFKVLSFLPLNHIYEKCVSYIYLFSGNNIYYAESLETIGDNLRELKPDCFTSVPRLLEKVFEKIMTAGRDLKGIKKKLFFWAIGLAERFDNNKSGGFWYDLQLSLANKIIFNKWRDALGGNIKFILSGGAACQEKLLRIFNAARIPTYEGYGPTENSPVIAVNRRTPGGNIFGTVGPVLNGVNLRLEKDGEICVNGKSMMKGYYKRPDLTNETIIDGWLHTGDIGEMVHGNFLKITDRKKELFKTSGGKYVAPQVLENKLKEDPLIEQVLVTGANQKFVGALIVPSFTSLKHWMELKEIPFTTPDEAISNRQVLEKYQRVIEDKNQFFNHVEQIKKFELLPKEWGIETGEMTPKMSLKRKVILEKYHAEIEKIYN